MAKLLIVLGVILVVIGAVWLVFPSAFAWLGRMPGDVQYRSGNVRVYFPIVTMIIISLIGTIVLNLFLRR